MRRQLWWLPAVIGVAAMIMAVPTNRAYGRGRGGGFARGGFSRGGPAEAGSFASRSGGMAAARGGEANQMEYGEHAQASRQQEMSALQSNREQAAKALQSSAQQYRGAYPYRGLGYPAWDAGAAGAAAIATGAAIGAAATAAPMAAAPGVAAAYTGGQPCANAVPVAVGPDTFYRCGSAWYREAYGPSGPVYLSVRPPGL
jgi:hypothetical protein